MALMRSKLTVGLMLVVVSAVVAGGLIWFTGPTTKADGPLPANGTISVVEYPDPPDAALAWGLALPPNPSSADATITGVSYDAHDVTVERIGFNRDDQIGFVLASDDLVLGPVDGFSLRAGSPTPYTKLVFVITVTGPEPHIDNVVVEYASGGDSYEWITEQSLVLYDVETTASA